MAYDMFLKVKGIDGDSTDKKHEKWIEVVSYSHGLSMPLDAQGLKVGTSKHQDFAITKRLDKASVMLAYKCCTGAEIPEVKLELCRATGEKKTFMVYSLTKCIVASFSPKGSEKAEDPLPMEEVRFAYGKIEWSYTATTPEGKGDETYDAIYDVHAAEETGGSND